MNVGELIVTEVSGTDAGGEWVELYNASGVTIDLIGVRVTLTKLDGSLQETFVVDASQQLAAGGYAVLDAGLAGLELPSGAGVDVVSCGRPIDRMIYRNLPNEGTHAFTGVFDPPDHAENDNESLWCNDLAGTPGERNPLCPE